MSLFGGPNRLCLDKGVHYISESEKLEFDKLKNTYIFEFEIDKKFYSVRANLEELAY